MYSVCRDVNTETTLYAKHNIYRVSLVNRMDSKPTFSWNSSGFSDLVRNNVANEYLQTTQAVNFARIGLNPNRDYFARGHLNPNADHPFQTWMKATYFYMNQVPQWQNYLNNGVWKQVENKVRLLTNGDNLVVYTGGHGQFIFRNANGITYNFCMISDIEHRSHIIVPKFIWKFVVTSTTSFAFVIMNDPFATVRDPQMCSDRDNYCQQTFHLNMNRRDRGFVSCCSIGHLTRMIGYDPTV